MAVVETDPNPVVLPPQTVQRGHDELVSRQVADRRQLAAVLSQPTTSQFHVMHQPTMRGGGITFSGMPSCCPSVNSYFT